MKTSKIFLLIALAFLAGAPKALATSDISVLTYNVFMRSPTWIFQDNHDWRTQEIPFFLKGYDAIVLQEAFSARHREQLIKALLAEYPYKSHVLGEGQYVPMNGGVIILSRWPIQQTNVHVFDGCSGSDCMVSKGAVYVSINKQGLKVHLFGLHLQAQIENGPVRAQQISQLQEFIQRQDIPSDELLLVAGDFNVNYFSRDSDGEFDLLTRVLQLAFVEDSPAPSYAKRSNTMVVDAVTERLDYVFYSTRHLIPAQASNEVLYFRKDEKDLSDHHAVLGRFTIDGVAR